MGIPVYPQDLATKFADLERKINALAAAAQSRVAFTGGTLTGDLSILGDLSANTLGAADLVAAIFEANELTATNGTVTNLEANDITTTDLDTDTLILNGLTVPSDYLALALYPPYAALALGAAQTITSSTLTNVTGLGYTATADGYHTVTGSVSWANSATGRREAGARRSDGYYLESSSMHSSTTTKLTNGISATMPLTVGQTVYAGVWQSSGAGLDVVAGRLEVVWRRPL